jgi:hypothetical protein
MLRLLNFSFNGDIHWFFFITNIKVNMNMIDTEKYQPSSLSRHQSSYSGSAG